MKYKKSLTKFFKKPLIIQAIFLAALLVIIFSLKISFNSSNSTSSDLATLFINFETEKRFFEGEVVDDMTILDALSLAVSVGKVRLNYVIDESDNVSIMEIDGHTNGIGNKHFVFYLNSQKVEEEDLNKEIVHAGDKIEIRNE